MLSINKVRLRHLMEQGHKPAQLTFRLLTRLDHVIGTLLVANNVVNVAISVLGSWIAVTLVGSDQGLALATALVTIVLLLVCEVTPKMFAATYPETVAFAIAGPLNFLMQLLYPLSAFFTAAARLILRVLRVPTRRRSPLVTEEEIKVMIQMGREAGVLAEHELRMLHRIFEFSDSLVSDAMVARGQIVGLDLNADPDAALDVLIEEGHSRIPVYQGGLDRIVGVIYARDIIAMMRHRGLLVVSDLIRPVLFVPPNRRLAELLGQFQREKSQIAIVKDAADRTIGLVTIEDLMEEIVGEVREAVPKKRAVRDA
jgi:CBS domain containing-hemolysin-like protein